MIEKKFQKISFEIVLKDELDPWSLGVENGGAKRAHGMEAMATMGYLHLGPVSVEWGRNGRGWRNGK